MSCRFKKCLVQSLFKVSQSRFQKKILQKILPKSSINLKGLFKCLYSFLFYVWIFVCFKTAMFVSGLKERNPRRWKPHDRQNEEQSPLIKMVVEKYQWAKFSSSSFLDSACGHVFCCACIHPMGDIQPASRNKLYSRGDSLQVSWVQSGF